MTTYRLLAAESAAANAAVDPSSVNLGMEFTVSATAWVTHLHFYNPTGTPVLTGIVGKLWRVNSASSGTQLASQAYTMSGTGWLTVTLATPVELTAGVKYRVGYYSPGNYPTTPNYWSSGPGSAGKSNGILSAPNSAGATGADQGSYAYGASGTFPVNSFNATNYWADVTVTDVDPTGGSTTAGTLSASVPRVTSSIAGTVTAPSSSGTLSASVPRVMASLTGTATSPSSSGTLSASTPPLTASIAGTVTPPTYSGTLSASLPTTTGSMSGTTTPPTYTGTLTAAFPPTRSTIAGTVTSPAGAATLSGTLPRVTGSLVGTVTAPTWTGTLGGQLAPITGTMVGTVTGPVFTGTLDGTLPGVTGTISGAATVPTGSGTLVAALPRVTASLAGVVQVDDDLVPASARILATAVRAPSARGVVRTTAAHGTLRTPTAQGRLR